MNRHGHAASLMPYRFKPGQSGNPSGRPKKKPLTEALERLGAKAVPNDETGRVNWDLVAEGLLTGAIAGKAENFREAADRIEGKLTDKIQHSGEVSYHIEPTRPQTREEWLAAHSESQRAMADADMGIDPTEGEPN